MLEIAKHPDADKLKLVKLDYGADEPKTVVTGATNIAPGQSGMKVVLGLRGTRYFYTDKDGKKTVFTLEPKALRGIMNDAMCMSNFELGISDEHEGIIILDDADPAPGTPLQDVLGDIVVELDVLPNMARCLSMIGIAREVAALTGAATHDCRAEGRDHRRDDRRQGHGRDRRPEAVPALHRDDHPQRDGRPGPALDAARLQYAGMRPINNVVDITNYVMLEWGQPLHAFDYDVLVQRAGGKAADDHRPPREAGEKLEDARRPGRELSPDNLVIADTAGADRPGRRHGRARNRGDRQRRRRSCWNRRASTSSASAGPRGSSTCSARRARGSAAAFTPSWRSRPRSAPPNSSASTPAARCSRASSTTTRPRRRRR